MYAEFSNQAFINVILLAILVIGPVYIAFTVESLEKGKWYDSSMKTPS